MFFYLTMCYKLHLAILYLLCLMYFQKSRGDDVDLENSTSSKQNHMSECNDLRFDDK